MSNSLLQWVGGKHLARKTICKLIPQREKIIISPFFGGGSIEFALAEKGIRVYGYDLYAHLISFWNEVLDDPSDLADRVQKYLPLDPEDYLIIRDKLFSNTSEDVNADFYVMNRTGWSGLMMERNTMSKGHKRFNQSSIDRLRNFKAEGVSVACLPFQESIAKHPDDYLYCDPPYVIKSNLYPDHENFDHSEFSELLINRDRWILSYNDCEFVRDTYAGHLIITPRWSYGINTDRKSKEVLIFSKDRKTIAE